MAAQCQGTTKRGARCSLTSISKIRDERGRLVAEPLRRGGSYCRFHARPFVARAMEERDQAESAMIVFLDFETTGLDVTKDEIVEIGALDARAGAVFSTVVCPGDVPAGPAVHGIDPAEIAEGPPFPEVWRRFVAFVDGAISMATVSDDSDSSQEDLPGLHTVLPEDPPVLVLAAHNGLRFDFAMLLCECLRHNVSLAPLQRWLFVDTLAVLQADRDASECMKLQCLVRSAGQVDGLRAHRALDDCYALSGVIQRVAWRRGVSLWSLMRGFALVLDLPASCAQIAVLVGD